MDLEQVLKDQSYSIENEKFYKKTKAWMIEISTFQIPEIKEGTMAFSYEGYEYLLDVGWHSNDVKNAGHTLYRCILKGLL